MIKIDEPFTYDEITKKISEFRKLTGRLNRYWRFLVKESLTEAQRRGLEVGVFEEGQLYRVYDTTIIKKGQETDVSDLINLAKPYYSSLNRRYNEGLNKHNLLRSQLEKINEDI